MSINRHVTELLLGFALATLVYTATALLAFADHKPGHPRPGSGGGAGGDDTKYDVTVSGDLKPKPNTTTTFVGHETGGRSKTVRVDEFMDLDLSFFIDEFNQDQPGQDRGTNCFAEAPLFPLVGFSTEMAIREERDTSALVQISFAGFADNGETQVNYALEMFGVFIGDWRPVDATTTVMLTSWEMSINNGGGVKNIACLGSHPDPFLTYIAVELQS